MQLHVDADVIGEAAGEQLRLLMWGEVAHVCHACLECI
jgi:hypothetical protein